MSDIDYSESFENQTSTIPLHEDFKENCKWIKEWFNLNESEIIYPSRVLFGENYLVFIFNSPQDWNGYDLAHPVDCNQQSEKLYNQVHRAAKHFKNLTNKYYYHWWDKKMIDKDMPKWMIEFFKNQGK